MKKKIFQTAAMLMAFAAPFALLTRATTTMMMATTAAATLPTAAKAELNLLILQQFMTKAA